MVIFITNHELYKIDVFMVLFLFLIILREYIQKLHLKYNISFFKRGDCSHIKWFTAQLGRVNICLSLSLPGPYIYVIMVIFIIQKILHIFHVCIDLICIFLLKNISRSHTYDLILPYLQDDTVLSRYMVYYTFRERRSV